VFVAESQSNASQNCVFYDEVSVLSHRWPSSHDVCCQRGLIDSRRNWQTRLRRNQWPRAHCMELHACT